MLQWIYHCWQIVSPQSVYVTEVLRITMIGLCLVQYISHMIRCDGLLSICKHAEAIQWLKSTATAI